MADLSEEELQALYCWIDEIPLSRAKKNIARDFSDGGERAPYIIARSIFTVDSLVYFSADRRDSAPLSASFSGVAQLFPSQLFNSQDRKLANTQ